MKTQLSMLALCLCALQMQAQVISGNVSAASDSMAIPGVNVMVKGTYSGTFTDMNGDFNLNYGKPDSVTLVFSAVGFEAKELGVNPIDSSSHLVRLEGASYQQDEVVLTASRASRNTATAYSNVDLQKIEARNFGQDLPYVLEMEPSVVVTSDAGAGVGYSGIRVRGTDPTRINVTINGIPVNDSESHGVWWVNMPDLASSVDNIQLQRGVGTSGNGAAAFGASINIQTAALNKKPYATISNGYGSFNTWKHTVAAGSGLLANRFSLDARLSKVSSDGYIDRATSDLKSFYVSGAFHGNKSLLRVNIFSGVEETYQAWYGVTQDSLATNRTFNPYTYENEVDHYQQDHYQLMFSQELSSKWNLNVNGHYTRGRGYFEQFREDDDLADYNLDDVMVGGDTITSSDFVRRRWLDNHFYGFTFGLNYSNMRQFSATIGGGWNQYLGDHYGEVIWSEYASNSEIRHRYYDNSAKKNDMNLYGKVNYFVHPKLSLFADIQFRRIDYTYEGPFQKEDSTLRTSQQTVRWMFFNPKAGINYEINSKNRVYASFAVANREPARKDLVESSQVSRPLHETLYDTEVGYQRATRRYQFGANLYWMNYKNQLVLSGRINDVGAYINQNVDMSDRYGVEFYWGWNIVKNLQWSANFTYSQNKIKNFVEYYDDYDNGGQVEIEHGTTDISFSPDFIAGSELVYEPVKNLKFALITKYVGEQFLDNTSSTNRKLNDYLLNNIRIGYSFNWKFFKEIQIGLLMNNIFDQKYESNGYTYSFLAGGETTTANFYYPQAGFNVMSNLTVKF
jgi:iron complex outermembrane receptor protein